MCSGGDNYRLQNASCYMQILMFPLILMTTLQERCVLFIYRFGTEFQNVSVACTCTKNNTQSFWKQSPLWIPYVTWFYPNPAALRGLKDTEQLLTQDRKLCVGNQDVYLSECHGM